MKGELPKCHILLCDHGGFKPFLLLNCGGPILLATVNVRNEQLHLHNSTIPRNEMIDLGTLLDRYNRTLFAFYDLIDFFGLILFFPSFFNLLSYFQFSYFSQGRYAKNRIKQLFNSSFVLIYIK